MHLGGFGRPLPALPGLFSAPIALAHHVLLCVARVPSAAESKLKYDLEYFTTIDFISQYDWQIARHEIHSKICEFVPLDQEHRPLVTGYLIDGPHHRNLNLATQE